MANDIATYLKFANVQMAAEALYGLKTAAPKALFSGLITPIILTTGNERSSKFTTTQATEFAEDWTIVEHISNTPTGFSGTLLRALRKCTNGVRSLIITPQHQMGSTPNGVTPNGVRSFIITPQ